MNEFKELVDIQNHKDDRGIMIQRVGIKNYKIQLEIPKKDNSIQVIDTNITMGVTLPEHYKGTHMSRFIEILESYRLIKKSKDITYYDILKLLLVKTQTILEAKGANIKCNFTYYLLKKSPVSKLSSTIGYNCSFSADIIEDKYKFVIGVEVPITTVCPCSKEISKYGAHNQRGLVNVLVCFDNEIYNNGNQEILWLEDLVELIEKQGSCEIYSLLKREDEKYVTETAYDNPKFVEDVLRDIYLELGKDNRIKWYSVDIENFESIHNHSAYAYNNSLNG